MGKGKLEQNGVPQRQLRKSQYTQNSLIFKTKLMHAQITKVKWASNVTQFMSSNK